MQETVAMTLFLAGIFMAIILLTAAMVAFLCSRSSRIAECATRTDAEGRRSPYNSPRHSMSYASSNRSTRRGSPISNLARNTSGSPQNGGISVSPSQPVVIETEDVEGGAVKIMITPPTPSKFKPDRTSSHFELFMDGRERSLEGSSRVEGTQGRNLYL